MICDWSTYEYIFNKKRNLLSTEKVEKLLYIHGDLRNTSASEKTGAAAARGTYTTLVRFRNEEFCHFLIHFKLCDN